MSPLPVPPSPTTSPTTPSPAERRANLSPSEKRRAELIDGLVEQGVWEGVASIASRFEQHDQDRANSANSVAEDAYIAKKDEVAALILRTAPEEIAFIDEMMMQFEGRENELISQLQVMEPISSNMDADNLNNILSTHSLHDSESTVNNKLLKEGYNKALNEAIDRGDWATAKLISGKITSLSSGSLSSRDSDLSFGEFKNESSDGDAWSQQQLQSLIRGQEVSKRASEAKRSETVKRARKTRSSEVLMRFPLRFSLSEEDSDLLRSSSHRSSWFSVQL